VAARPSFATRPPDGGRRLATRAIALAWLGYVAFAFATRWTDYGLVAPRDGLLAWTLLRIATVSAWLLLALWLVRRSARPARWRGFAVAFTGAGVAALAVAPSLVSALADRAAVAGTLAFYALVSGFLGVRVRKPALAAGLGALLFVAQLGVDGAVQVFSGQYRLH